MGRFKFKGKARTIAFRALVNSVVGTVQYKSLFALLGRFRIHDSGS